MLRFHNLNRRLQVSIILVMSLLVFVPNVAQAHRDGCHRWHSCPSDSGSYVCGDLGYDSQCPKAAAPVPVAPAPVAVEQQIPVAVEQQTPVTVEQQTIVQPEPTVVNIALNAGTVIKNANLRSGPGTNFGVVGTATKGQIFNIVGKNDNGTWYKLDSGQWIANFLINMESTATAVPAAPQSQQLATDHKKVTVLKNANLRAGPGTSFAIVGHAKVGQVLEVIGQNANGTWYQLTNECWIAAFLVSKV